MQFKCVFFIVAVYLAIILLFYHGYASGDEGVEIMHVPDLTDVEVIEEGSLWSVPDYAGNIWSRPALTGDWGGIRKKLTDKGITLSVDTVQTYQNIIDGGTDTGGEYGGSVDYEILLDFNKMGLWPGAFMRIFAETQFGDFVNPNTGTFAAANTDGLFPEINDEKTTLTSFTYYQFLSEWLALFLGKLETLDGDTNTFAGGRGKEQFLNQNFVFNPVTVTTVPYSALGGGVLFVLPENIGSLSFAALDPNGTASKVGFDDAFDDGVVLASELRVGVKPFGLPGHHLFGGSWSSKDFTSLGQDFRRLLFDFISGVPVSLDKTSDSWSFYYNFDQYLYVEDEDHSQGIGVFGRFGMADRDTNPVENFYSAGIGGKGIIPGRDNDTFGIGYYYINASDKFRFIHKGQGGEIFYNIEVTPWIHITPDFQIIDPGLKRVETNYIAGIRFKIDL
jgi:porin